MKAMREIETLAEFDRALEARWPSMVVQGVDLRARGAALEALEGAHVFVGCAMEPRVMASLIERGCVVLPTIEGLPFYPFRPSLYSATELYEGLERGYVGTPDQRAYAWYRAACERGALLEGMAMALHDQSITDALDELLVDRRVAAVMGGHKLQRGTEGFRQAAVLGRALARAGFVVATGGGPGAMEAANLGAHMAPHEDGALDEALAMLAEVPSFQDDIGAWARVGMRVRERFAQGAALSVGVPTWFYGHEPPNVFGSHIAKYFSNALREDGLLARANAGIVFLRGAAGTVQEIFQDATQNYYAREGEAALAVLVDRAYWTETLPAWPLVEALGRGREMGRKLFLVDDVQSAAAILARGG